jgi:hypothetical protein
MVVSKWTFLESNSAQAKAVFSRSPEVSSTQESLRENVTLVTITITNDGLTGNVYSFANPYEKDVRLFFTQGCVPDEDSEEDSGTTSQAVEQGNSDGETEAEAGASKPKPKAKPAAARGRKGKQKAGK